MKTRGNSPGETIPGALLLDALYTMEELRLRLDWSESTVQAAHCQGLQVYHLGGNAYVTGRDLLDFLKAVPKSTRWFDVSPATPHLLDVDQGAADEACANAQGCCEACHGPAYGVAREQGTQRAQVLCQAHFDQAVEESGFQHEGGA
jgi:hypothetical protein